MNVWHEGTIADLADIIMGQSPPGESCSSDNIGLPLLNGPTEFGLVHPVAVQYTADSKREAKRNDILFCVRGSTTGRMNWADQPYSIGRGLAAIRHKKGEKYRHYLKGIIDYYLPHLLTAATGSTFPNVSKDQILGLKVMLPSLTEQEAIADMLSSISDKIEMNQRMNETLEAMARALFKSWFVDFDPVRAKAQGRKPKGMDAATAALFPAALNHDGLPEGWKIRPLGEYVVVKRGGSPRPIHDFLAPDGLPWVKISDATACTSPYLMETKQFIKEAGLKKTVFLKRGSLILSNSATPGLPRFLDLDACIHDGWLYFPEKKVFSDFYLYQLFLILKETLISHGNGSVFTNLKTDILKNQLVSIPDEKTISAFDNLVVPIFQKILLNERQTQTLCILRDTLLPKLISGELSIADAAPVRNEAVG